MKPVYRGIGVAVLQCLMVLGVAGKYALDRERLPRVWAKSAPFDPNLPIRGRYVRLGLQVEGLPSEAQYGMAVRLSAVGGRLVATPDPAGSVHLMSVITPTPAVPRTFAWALTEPVAFFLPEHVADPSRRAAGEELWVEVSVPAKGSPRPIRLGVKKNGVLAPLDLR